MTRGRRWLVTVAVVALGLASPRAASAQAGRSAPTRMRPGAGGVLDSVVGERREAVRILIEARARLLTALDRGREDVLGPADDTLLEQAIARYGVVAQVRPEDVDVWLEQGIALSEFRRVLPDGQLERRIPEAIACFERARAIDPDRDASWVAFELALLHGRQRDYRAASDEYARSLAFDTPLPAALTYDISEPERRSVVLFHPHDAATILGNWAEVRMLDGDVEQAIALYRRAHAAAPHGSLASALALWGLALAEERAGSHGDALSDAARAIDASPVPGDAAAAALVARHGVFAALHADGVAFDPPSEIYAYEALGHEALAARASNAEARASELTAALRSTRYFLAEGGRESIYASTAARAESRLSDALAPERSERRRP